MYKLKDLKSTQRASWTFDFSLSEQEMCICVPACVSVVWCLLWTRVGSESKLLQRCLQFLIQFNTTSLRSLLPQKAQNRTCRHPDIQWRSVFTSGSTCHIKGQIWLRKLEWSSDYWSCSSAAKQQVQISGRLWTFIGLHKTCWLNAL